MFFLRTRLGDEIMKLQDKTAQTLKAIGIPVSVFCRKIGFSDTAYYRWLHGDLNLSEATERRIKDYIRKFEEVI